MNLAFDSVTQNSVSPSSYAFLGGSNSIHHLQSNGVMECHEPEIGDTNKEKNGDGEVRDNYCKEEEIDEFIERMGFIVSNCEGKEVKLSIFLGISRGTGLGRKRG